MLLRVVFLAFCATVINSEKSSLDEQASLKDVAIPDVSEMKMVDVHVEDSGNDETFDVIADEDSDKSEDTLEEAKDATPSYRRRANDAAPSRRRRFKDASPSRRRRSKDAKPFVRLIYVHVIQRRRSNRRRSRIWKRWGKKDSKSKDNIQ